ncbi:MAG TPA: carbon-nitrogen hydrolase [Gemmatimonadaceae bacterium]|jgi:N-carbamoylputrescine amidase|nr:carbon-nitrogen hydrolase [Gemmatimonadaceae bacterium]
MPPFTVGLIQAAVGDDIATNVRDAQEKIREAASRGAQIICLQELFDAPYFAQATKAERFDLAEPIPGPTVTSMQALAKSLSVVLIVPIFEREAAGVYRNSAAVIDADGSLLGVYRKLHIPDDPQYYEKYYFTPGDTFRVWPTKRAKVGTLICWDQWFPEGARITSLLGAEILFYPTAIGWHPAEKDAVGQDQLSAWQTIQRSHAIANGVFVAAVNRVGHEPEPGTKGIEFWGHSFIADPFGRVIAQAGTGPEVLVATCDPAIIEETRRNWPFLRDRRVDAYAPIGNRFIG